MSWVVLVVVVVGWGSCGGGGGGGGVTSLRLLMGILVHEGYVFLK